MDLNFILHGLPKMSENYSLSPYQEDKTSRINKLSTLDDDQKKQVLAHFHKYPQDESAIDWNSKDLEWDDFAKVMDNRASKSIGRSARVSKSGGIKDLEQGVDYQTMYQTKGLTAYAPLSYKGSRYLASGGFLGTPADWCIANPTTNQHWSSYTKRGITFVFWILTDSDSPYNNGGFDKFATAVHSSNLRTENFDRFDNTGNMDTRRGPIFDEELVGYLGIGEDTFRAVVEKTAGLVDTIKQINDRPHWVVNKIFADPHAEVKKVLGSFKVHYEGGVVANSHGPLAILYDAEGKEIRKIDDISPSEETGQPPEAVDVSYSAPSRYTGGVPQFLVEYTYAPVREGYSCSGNDAYTLDGKLLHHEYRSAGMEHDAQSFYVTTYYSPEGNKEKTIQKTIYGDTREEISDVYHYHPDGSLKEIHFQNPPYDEKKYKDWHMEGLRIIEFFPSGSDDPGPEYIKNFACNRDEHYSTDYPFDAVRDEVGGPWVLENYSDRDYTAQTRKNGPVMIDRTAGDGTEKWLWNDNSKGVRYYQIRKGEDVIKQWNAKGAKNPVEEFDGVQTPTKTDMEKGITG